MLPKLGILAGGGELPRLLIQACQSAGRPVFVIAFKGQCDKKTTADVDHAWVRIGAAGKSIELLKANGVEELVMAGRIQKPSVSQLMPDARTLKFLANGVMNKGDDSVLSAIVHTLETDEGFTFVGVHDVMPELLAPEGVLGSVLMDEDGARAMHAAVHAALDLGAQDTGQAAVATGAAMVALEDRAGTDAMLKGLKGNADAHGAVLAKMCKPGQEKRADLPTIGVATIEHAAAAGLAGVVVEAGASLIINRTAVIEAADRLGLFLVGAKPA
ncbi:LpxI family protein [Pseudomonadota bacterium]